jgi:hypothetical protein
MTTAKFVKEAKTTSPDIPRRGADTLDMWYEMRDSKP